MPRKIPAEDETHLLNVDLEIWSTEKRTPMVTAMKKRGFMVLTASRWIEDSYLASFECRSDARGRVAISADVKTRELAKAIEALPPKARKLFDNAKRRVFDIGNQGEKKTNGFQLALSSSTVKRVAALNAEIGVTVYAANRPAPHLPAKK
ncbi:hypothetical protein BH11MYX2_BH11MYX2_12270 [soil metagenome]